MFVIVISALIRYSISCIYQSLTSVRTIRRLSKNEAFRNVAISTKFSRCCCTVHQRYNCRQYTLIKVGQSFYVMIISFGS